MTINAELHASVPGQLFITGVWRPAETARTLTVTKDGGRHSYTTGDAFTIEPGWSGEVPSRGTLAETVRVLQHAEGHHP